MIQAGDETGTGRGGVSIYGTHFKDEFHSRLKFTHRGIVACANQNAPNTNNSQFFITLDRCEDLDNRYTIFGKVVGDTIFNVIRISEVPVDSRSRPLEPIGIEGCEVLWNPFEDIIPRIQKPSTESQEDSDQQITRQKKKGVKNLALLSFGEDEEIEEMEQSTTQKKKIRSAHDVLDDNTLVHEDEETRQLRLKEEEKRKQKRIENVRNTLATKPLIASTLPETNDAKPSLEERLKAKLQSSKPDTIPMPIMESSPVPTSIQERPQMGFDRLYVKKRKPMETEEDTALLNKTERYRERLKQRKKLYGEREKATLAKLRQFQSSLNKDTPSSTYPAPKKSTESSVNVELPAAWRVGDYLKDMERIGVTELLTHELRFDKTQKDSMSRDMHALDDYIVIDSRLESSINDDINVEKWDHKPNS
eukprot:g5318.t1